MTNTTTSPFGFGQTLYIEADYFQFYLWDEAIAPDVPTGWDSTDIARRIKVAPHIVVVTPERDGIVTVDIELHASEPPFDATDWDHVVECSLDLPSGKLQIHQSVRGPVAGFDMPPGIYRIRVFFGGLAKRENGEPGADHYHIFVWPGPMADVAVLKAWSDAGTETS